MHELLTTFLMTALIAQYPLLPTMGLAGLFLLNDNYSNDDITEEQAEEKTIKEIFLLWLAVTLCGATFCTAIKFFI